MKGRSVHRVARVRCRTARILQVQGNHVVNCVVPKCFYLSWHLFTVQFSNTSDHLMIAANPRDRPLQHPETNDVLRIICYC